MSDTNSFKHTVEKTFAPMIDAVKAAGSKIEMPEAARDLVKRTAEMAKDRAADMHSGSAQATDAIEGAATKAVSGLARWTRDVQTAVYDDASAYFTSIGKIASASSVSEAVQLHVDYLRERSNVNIGRAKAMFETLSGSIAEAGKTAQETVSKVANFNKAA